jgi:hypothetical protein
VTWNPREDALLVIADAGSGGAPHIVPVGFRLGAKGTIEIGGQG